MIVKISLYFLFALLLSCSANSGNEKKELLCLPEKIQSIYALPICINEEIDSVKKSVETFHYDKSVKMYVSSYVKGTQIYGAEYRFGDKKTLDTIIVFGGSAYGRQNIDITRNEIGELKDILQLGNVSTESSGSYSAKMGGIQYQLVITFIEKSNSLDYKLIIARGN